MRRITRCQRRADGEQSRARILDAATEIAAERGYEGTSIGAVSAKCGLPASSIYWHFKDKDDLIAALEKTARQAERAGQIIHRIRAFVKRSEPQRQSADARDIIDDAVELANIDLRRRRVQLNTYIAQRMPLLGPDEEAPAGGGLTLTPMGG